jgi:hypothetical protein
MTRDDLRVAFLLLVCTVPMPAVGFQWWLQDNYTPGLWRVWVYGSRDSDGTATAAANGDLPVPQDCQARAGTASSRKTRHDR